VNKSMLIGAVLAGAGVLSLGVAAGYQKLKGPQYAEVLSVEPVRQTTSTPAEQCKDVQVTHRKPVKDEKRIAGTVIGGVVGGVLGNQFGRGNGNAVATVAGAAGGAYAGNQVQKNMQEKDTYTATERRCTTVNRRSVKVVGYDVKYLMNGKISTVRMDHKPGERIAIKSGKPLLS
jgi:uncharacterized protein YcfJ